MLHLLLFYIPYHQHKVEAMSGGMSMMIVAGKGTPGGAKAAEKGPEGPAKPKAVAEPQSRQEEQAVPESKPEPVVPQQQKPVPVVHKQPITPPQPKPVVRRQPVVKTTAKPVTKPVVKAKPVHKQVRPVEKAVKKTAKKKPVKTRRAKTVTKQVAVAKAALSAPVVKNAGSASAPGDKQSAQNTGQGQNTEKAKAGGAASRGPVQARFGSMFGPKITRWMRPKYPRKARDLGQTGLVVLRITIDAAGRAVHVEVAKRAGGGFDEAAVAAARKSAFAPATHKGRPVACVALLPVRFNLKGQ